MSINCLAILNFLCCFYFTAYIFNTPNCFHSLMHTIHPSLAHLSFSHLITRYLFIHLKILNLCPSEQILLLLFSILRATTPLYLPSLSKLLTFLLHVPLSSPRTICLSFACPIHSITICSSASLSSLLHHPQIFPI